MSLDWKRLKRRWRRRGLALVSLIAAHWLAALAIAIYGFGVFWRIVWIFIIHTPNSQTYIFSDMKFYDDIGRGLRDAHHVMSPGDVTHPPGMSLLVAWLMEQDWLPQQHLAWLPLLQFLVSALAPIALAALALNLLNRRSAWWTLILSSLYFPFIDYAGYLLAEGYIILLIPLVLVLFVAAMRAKRWQWAVVLGILAGVLWCVGIAFKLVLLPGMLCFGAVYLLLFKSGVPPARRALVTGMVILGLLPGLARLSLRATRANEGRWCLVSNKDGADFLLGHYGRIQKIEWRDPEGREFFGFGSPSAVQRGYTEARVVHFRMTDAKSNWREAEAWIAANPGPAAVLSCEHVYDIFFTGVPWPTSATPFWPWAEAFHYLFIAFLLIPSLLLLVLVALRRGVLAMLHGPEFLILSPVFGVMVSVFMTTGELRYRIPWDGAFILLAIEFYRYAYNALRTPAPIAEQVPIDA